jgi:hypothetical protein
MPVLINKRGLARMLGVSIPTVSAILDRYPDFRSRREGRVGLEWQFNSADVQAFLAGKRALEAATASATRDTHFAQVSSRSRKPTRAQPRPFRSGAPDICPRSRGGGQAGEGAQPARAGG